MLVYQNIDADGSEIFFCQVGNWCYLKETYLPLHGLNYHTTDRLIIDRKHSMNILNLFSSEVIFDEDYSKLVNDSSEQVRTLVALNGEYLEHLSVDKSATVRGAVASLANDDLLDFMLDDSDHYVRCIIASRGIKKFNNELASDLHYKVRLAVAKHGVKKHCNMLIGDSNELVRKEAFKHCSSRYLDAISACNYLNYEYSVMYQGRFKDLKKLCKNSSSLISRTAKRELEDKISEYAKLLPFLYIFTSLNIIYILFEYLKFNIMNINYLFVLIPFGITIGLQYFVNKYRSYCK